ncbi:thioredoxin TrxC [Orrella daihaiensis]|uniref:Thioredoxin n=1 Tax=Orrella daihaiensis TaxID=2782176 RepID=A0ABY4ANZ0_9BURK|nr:thioredoxin TrxC [Orrella daihaiensis]UOD49759.1 thioredoxin TrxC [Orrella daihaiensis]
MNIRCPHCNKLNRVANERLGEHPSCGACGEPLLTGVLSLDRTALDDLLAQSSLPVLVDFWAPWCGPCRMFAPTFEAAAKKHGQALIFAKLDTEANQAAGAKFNIRSIPTLAVFHRGQELGRVSGALPPAQLEELVGNVLAHTSKP